MGNCSRAQLAGYGLADFQTERTGSCADLDLDAAVLLVAGYGMGQFDALSIAALSPDGGYRWLGARLPVGQQEKYKNKEIPNIRKDNFQYRDNFIRTDPHCHNCLGFCFFAYIYTTGNPC